MNEHLEIHDPLALLDEIADELIKIALLDNPIYLLGEPTVEWSGEVFRPRP